MADPLEPEAPPGATAARADPLLDRLLAALARHEPRLCPELGRAAAVLVPLLPRASGLTFLFTERSKDLSSHAGQVSFPGGRIDPEDASPTAAALREAREEVGLDPGHVRLVGQLDDCPTIVSGFVITPIVAVVDEARLDPSGSYPWQPSAHEVVALHELPAADFLVPGNLRTEQRELWGEQHEVYWYTVRGVTVWGATARIVHQLLSLA
jgi:8-oxo-dGTP pyrophosphatase MutT (NUDIX family)